MTATVLPQDLIRRKRDGLALSPAEIAFLVNERQENIGARRLHTVLEKLLEKLSFEAPDKGGLSLMVDRAMVDAQLGDAVQDPDLSRYIL